ncbi:MAG TPA: glycosyltransferase family 2 protein [Candidatus Thermoplasmatota archaeon]|nr:glycosyltransferase family 2 protein [Candidatus Thermoplasmatota archaeon]
MIAIVLITHNRVHLLRRCVEDVLLRTSPLTREIVVWDNGSTDGTRAYLETVADPRVKAVHHPENVGMNGYARAVQLTTQPYLIELDDDVVEAPHRWDETLLDAFRRLPRMGYLSAALTYDPSDAASRWIRYLREVRNAYVERDEEGLRLLEGPTGGACTITSREIYDRVGGFRERPRRVFYREDADYVRRLRRAGYRTAILATLEVSHAGGDIYSEQSPEKKRHQEREWTWIARKDRVKRILLGLPGFAAVNDRLSLFDPPYEPSPLLRPDVARAEADRTEATRSPGG